jgi:hypothetical protein
MGAHLASIVLERTWKGARVGDTVQVWTARSGRACGYALARTERHLLYGQRRPDGQLWVTLCSLTKPLAAAQSDIAQLEQLGQAR